MLPIKKFNIKNYMKKENQEKKVATSQQSLANSLVAQNLAGMNPNSEQIQQPAAQQ